jgi:hypothetical protein
MTTHYQLGVTRRGSSYTACGADCSTSARRNVRSISVTTEPTEVTCKRCQRSPRFKAIADGGPTKLNSQQLLSLIECGVDPAHITKVRQEGNTWVVDTDDGVRLTRATLDMTDVLEEVWL